MRIVYSFLSLFSIFLLSGKIAASAPLLVDFDVGPHRARLKVELFNNQTITFNIESAADLDALASKFQRLKNLSEKESYRFTLPIEQVAWLLSYTEQVKPLVSAAAILKEDQKDLIDTLSKCSWWEGDSPLDCHITVKEQSLRRESREALALDMRSRAQNIFPDLTNNAIKLAQRLQTPDQTLSDEFSKQAVLLLHLAYWQHGVEALNTNFQRYSGTCAYSPFDPHYEHMVVGWSLDDLSNMCGRFTKIEHFAGEGRPYLSSTPTIVAENILISGVCPHYPYYEGPNNFTPAFGLTTAEVEARCDMVHLGFNDNPARGIASQHLINLKDGKQATTHPLFDRVKSLETALIRQPQDADPFSMDHETLFSTTTTDSQRIHEVLGAFYQEVGGVPSLCFDPHHKLVVTTTDGDVYTLLICFGCKQAKVWRNNEQISTLFLRSDFSSNIIESAAHGAYWSKK